MSEWQKVDPMVGVADGWYWLTVLWKWTGLHGQPVLDCGEPMATTCDAGGFEEGDMAHNWDDPNIVGAWVIPLTVPDKCQAAELEAK